MKKYGIFYGSTTGNTQSAAESLHELIGQDKSDLLNISESSADDMLAYEHLVLGSSTWGYGDLQDDWESFLSSIESKHVEGKKVSLFGTGDAQMYPDTFVDAIGLIYEKVQSLGAEVVGQVEKDEYQFDDSKAIVDGKFIGLPLDEDNESDLSDSRIKKWFEKVFI